MADVSLSGDEKSLGSILSWYEDQLAALKDFRIKVIDILIHSNMFVNVNVKFETFTLKELDRYFEESQEELDYLTCFNIISATEAHLKVDYINRVRRKDKSPIGRIFRNFDKKRGKRVSLEEHIIDSWKSETKDSSFSDFLGLLKYRHWLAHGRYWKPKLGRYYSVDDASIISEAILKVISNN